MSFGFFTLHLYILGKSAFFLGVEKWYISGYLGFVCPHLVKKCRKSLHDISETMTEIEVS